MLLWMVTAGVASAAELSIPHEMYTLDNGLEVILAPDTSTPIVFVSVYYHVGAKDEKPGLSGFAHLFEHLMFQGSAHTPGEYFTPLQEVGADVNGSTGFDVTEYHEELPSRYLPLALFMESDRMGWLLPVFDLTKLDNQREVVRNERRQRYENPPYGEVWVDLYGAMFPEAHPYHLLPIGSHEDLEAADVEAVKDFFTTWYVPNNATLVVSGDFEPETAKALIEAQFGAIPRGADPEPVTKAEPVVLAESKVIRQEDDVPEQKVWMAWHSPKLYAPGDADLDLMSSVLADGKDSRLYKVLVKERQIAKDISAWQSSMMLSSMYVITGTAAEGHTTDELVAAVDEVLADVLGAHPPTAEEIAAARASYEVGFWHGLETISGKGERLNGYRHLAGTPDFLKSDLQRYLDATPESVLAHGKATLGGHRVVLHVVPNVAATEGGE